ncbi:MAG: hypothetical protein Q4C64_00535 [Erysipelotrichia bacterium]|nr:hypothetical protein [Erysipelotrichia bacterium]
MNNDNKVRVCKKCQRLLPEGYKHRYCEACRNKQAENLKKAIMGTGGIVLSAIAGIFLHKKIGPDK